MPEPTIKNLFIAIFVCLTIYLQFNLWAGDTGLVSLNNIKDEIRQIAKQGNEIIVQTKKVKRQVLNLNAYPEAIEALGRKNLGLIKPNEKFATLKEKKDKAN